MKYAVIIITVAALVVFSAASSVLASGGCWGSGWSGEPGWTGPGWRGGPEGSALTPEQQQKANDLRIAFLKRTERLRTQINGKRLELMELSRKPDPDQKAIEKAEQELWSLQDTMRNEYRTFDRKLANIVPPKQRQRFRYGGSRGYSPRYCGLMGGPGCSWGW